MFDLKVINSVLTEMEDERGISREKMLDAIEQSLATAYKKEFGKRGQIITCEFDMDSGTTNFNQVKIVVDETMLKPEPELDEDGEPIEVAEEEVDEEADKKVRFDEEKHIMLGTAQMIKKGAEPGEELIFPLEAKDDFGRIAAQTAKQVIMQKIREAEKESALAEFGSKAGDIIIVMYSDLNEVIYTWIWDESLPSCRTKNRFRGNDSKPVSGFELSCSLLKRPHVAFS